jgi:hypothetical protein
MAGIVLQSWEDLVAEELSLGLDDADPDELLVEGDDCPLSCERSTSRWELDPASAEDYLERHRAVRLSERWRHFGH